MGHAGLHAQSRGQGSQYAFICLPAAASGLKSLLTQQFQEGALQEVFMVCYQVVTQFAFIRHKPVLVSTRIKKQHAAAFLVRSGLPFGRGLKHRRFFRTEKEASGYVAHLHAVYKGRIISNPPLPGGQLYLFQAVPQ
jgi:hypothetical protein